MSLIEIADPPTRTASSTSTSEVRNDNPPDHPNAADAKTRAKERAKYLALANKPGSTYGSTNHGRAAIPLIQESKPRFVVDFGCGRNDLVRDLRRLGIDGLGVDFAFPRPTSCVPCTRPPCRRASPTW